MEEDVSIETVLTWQHVRKESERLEFKEAKSNFDRDRLFKYCVAIANEGGGHLVLGMGDAVPREIVGTNAFRDLSVLKKDIRSNVRLNVSVNEVKVDGKRVVTIQLPARPRGTAYDYKGAYYMRSGDELLPMTEDKLRSIFSETKEEWGLSIIRNGLAAKDICDLLDVSAFMNIIGLPPTDNTSEITERLEAHSLIVREGAGFAMRQMAALVLARDIRDFPTLERKSPRLITYNGKDKLNTKLDITGQRGYAAGFQGLIRLCMQHMPQNEVVQNALRQKMPLFPEHCIREVVANALIHQDLSATGTGPIIEIFSNRIEVSNPGKPVVPVERFIDGFRSRNERLAWVMRQLKICEERSSGVDRMVAAAEMYQLPAPEFISTLETTHVVIHGHRIFREMTQEDRIRACYQHCVLKYVMREQMTNDSLRGRFGLKDDNATTSKIIRATADAGLIAADPSAGNSRKFARYVPSWSLAAESVDSLS
ncbi:ATP-binding protein [Amaricoccus solimangrovi]|uniref:MloB n=1 Tax=Amaricoccus solimangrovi TaxID=2589815 RepID=A0A501W554_9RHOB|nr:ATP-binding protein [Amaricoccus solimangrovi]TPE45073.1 MloB [Amaricoccus solimangrovi]